MPEAAATADAQAQADAQAVSGAVAEQLPSPAERLGASRERMRAWMLQVDGRQERRRRAAAAAAEGRSPPWLDRLREVPVVGTVVEAVQAWWAKHPLRPVASMAQTVVRDTVAPVARRHPIIVVAGAFAIGAALVRLRPWRWMLKPALFAGLTTQIITRVIASVPLESVFESMASFGHRAETPDEVAAAESDMVRTKREEEVAAP
ncbi:hypothetical protein [Piscinibacter sp.]|uniref:hypothetical protein n=1 Tax=Piscinibacter sp. TaxID=1903157 RepID=UPI002ED400C2